MSSSDNVVDLALPNNPSKGGGQSGVPLVDGDCCANSGVTIGAGGSTPADMSLLVMEITGSGANPRIETSASSNKSLMQIKEGRSSIQSLDSFESCNNNTTDEEDSSKNHAATTMKNVITEKALAVVDVQEAVIAKKMQQLSTASGVTATTSGASAFSESSGMSSTSSRYKRRKNKQRAKAAEQELANSAAKSNDNSPESFSTVVITKKPMPPALSVDFNENGSVKRQRDVDNTPESTEVEPKKSRVEHSTKTYSEAAASSSSSSLNVFIRLADDEETLDFACGDHIKNEISRHQYSLDQRMAQFIPRFIKTNVRANEMQVECADKPSMDWLMEKVAIIAPYEGVGFISYSQSTLPKLENLSVFFFKKQNTDVKELLNRIQLSNPELHTNRWRILFVSERQAGLVLAVGVDPTSLRHLQQLEMRPFFEMGRVTFQNLKNTKKSD